MYTLFSSSKFNVAHRKDGDVAREKYVRRFINFLDIAYFCLINTSRTLCTTLKVLVLCSGLTNGDSRTDISISIAPLLVRQDGES